jgi:hypothetical protein
MRVAELIAERERQLDVIKEAQEKVRGARSLMGLLNKLIAQYGALEGNDIPRTRRKATAATGRPRKWPKVEPIRGKYHCPEKGCTEKFNRPQELGIHRSSKHQGA